MALLLVPFNATWIDHDKIDVHGIYRRPRFKEDTYGEMQRERDKDGLPLWDLTGPLPVKQHNRWLAKGFEYVTLASRDDLLTAAKHQTLLEQDSKTPTGNWRQYDQHQTGGPWNWKKYAEGQDQALTADAQRLRADVEKYGSAVVEEIRRGMDAKFRLPEHLRNIPPALAVPDAAALGAPPVPEPFSPANGPVEDKVRLKPGPKPKLPEPTGTAA